MSVVSAEEELREQVRRFVDQEIALDELQDWLGGHVQALADSADAVARRLDGMAWALISEYDLGFRTEDEVREELAADLATVLSEHQARSVGAQEATAPPFRATVRLAEMLAVRAHATVTASETVWLNTWQPAGSSRAIVAPVTARRAAGATGGHLAILHAPVMPPGFTGSHALQLAAKLRSDSGMVASTRPANSS